MMPRSLATVLLLAGAVMAARAAELTPEEKQGAIDAGVAAGIAMPKPDAAAQDPGMVPGYQGANPPETGYYVDPAAMETDGAQAAQDNIGAQVTTDHINNSDLNISDTDPILTQAAPVENNAETFVGIVQGTYSDCVPTQITKPAETTPALCHSTRLPENVSCNNTLAVTVTRTPSCVVGTTLATFYLYTNVNPDKGWFCRATGTVFCGPNIDGVHAVKINVDAAAAPKGGGYGATSYDWTLDTSVVGAQQNSGLFRVCNFTLGNAGCDANDNCTLTFTDSWQTTTATFQRSRQVVSTSDAWNNGCATYEGRSQ